MCSISMCTSVRGNLAQELPVGILPDPCPQSRPRQWLARWTQHLRIDSHFSLEAFYVNRRQNAVVVTNTHCRRPPLESWLCHQLTCFLSFLLCKMDETVYLIQLLWILSEILCAKCLWQRPVLLNANSMQLILFSLRGSPFYHGSRAQAESSPVLS